MCRFRSSPERPGDPVVVVREDHVRSHPEVLFRLLRRVRVEEIHPDPAGVGFFDLPRGVIRRIEPEMIDVYRMNSGLNLTIIVRVYLPMMSGYMKQAFINAAGMGLKVIVTSEYLVQTRDSLGKTIYTASYFNEYPDIYAYALIMIGLVALLTGVPRLLIRAAENRRKPVTSSQFPFR